MKQIMIGMMGTMTPHLKSPIFTIDGRGFGLGVIGWILAAIGGFYTIFQLMGRKFGMPPTINFGDPGKFKFNMVEFWKLGAAMLVPGVICIIARNRK